MERGFVEEGFLIVNEVGVTTVEVFFLVLRRERVLLGSLFPVTPLGRKICPSSAKKLNNCDFSLTPL